MCSRFGDVFRLASMVFSDKSGNGLTNLYSMISYCLNESECRRKLIAKHFDEVWQSSDCHRMCDVCTRPPTYIAKRDCREEASMIIDYLHKHPKPRLTPLKLLEQLTITTMIRIDLQRLILQLLMDEYLKEDFSFTSYNTICYVIPGPKAKYIRSGSCEIVIDMIASTRKRTATVVTKDDKQWLNKRSLLPGTICCFSCSPSTSILVEIRPKLRWVTNTDPIFSSAPSKKRHLPCDHSSDDDNQTENTSLSERQLSCANATVETPQSSVIDNEELDFL
jgi:hypothetical protein